MKWILKAIISQKKYKVVSFDLFDTLVERETMIPSDVFAIVGKKILGRNEEEFRTDRIQAEKKARQEQLSGEVTIHQIYDQLPLKYQTVRQELEKQEIEEEIRTCRPRKEMQDVYRHCIDFGKKTVITTDMYLPKSVIIRILQKCEYQNYQFIYLSNEYNESKRQGGLFEKIVADNKGSCKEIIHIGDSLRADYLSARKKGITAYLVIRSHWIRRKIYEKSIRSQCG